MFSHRSAEYCMSDWQRYRVKVTSTDRFLAQIRGKTERQKNWVHSEWKKEKLNVYVASLNSVTSDLAHLINTEGHHDGKKHLESKPPELSTYLSEVFWTVNFMFKRVVYSTVDYLVFFKSLFQLKERHSQRQCTWLQLSIHSGDERFRHVWQSAFFVLCLRTSLSYELVSLNVFLAIGIRDSLSDNSVNG